MRRRVPKLLADGLFNYIPERCPQWQKSKKCNKEDRCHRSHGWLEIIFHPLLFKTKICKSNHKNGVCREYGVYCAKAHNPTEIRNLVKIYGENWKRHYDLSLRETNTASLSIAKSQRGSTCGSAGSSRMQSARDVFEDRVMDQRNIVSTCPSEQNNNGTRTNARSKSTSFAVVNSSANSPFFFALSPLFGEFNSICDLMADIPLDRGVSSYTQLYSDTGTLPEVKNSDLKIPDPEMQWDRSWHSSRTTGPLQESQSESSSNSYFMSPLRDTWRISESLDLDWKMDVKQGDKENRLPDELNN